MNEISRWQEAISALPDKQFFNIMRLYLGEIKTPYNKQRLIEQLAGFIHNSENINTILSLLDDNDVKILTAIYLIPKTTVEVLADFFTGSYTFSDIFSKIINLNDRLLIYSEKEDFTGREYLFINPLIEEKLKPYLNLSLILQNEPVTFYSMDDVFCITPNFLASFISYIRIHGINCKNDGTIKKNDLNRLEEIFPGHKNCLQLLMNAFFNLSLVRDNSCNFSVDTDSESTGGTSFTSMVSTSSMVSTGSTNRNVDLTRLQAFAELPQKQQMALLCAASVSRFSKEGLKKEAQLLLDSIVSIPETGYTRQTILRLAYLIGTYTEDGSAIPKKSRFSKMLEAARGTASEDPQQNAHLLDRMIDSAIEFGIIRSLGKTQNGETVYVAGTEEYTDSSENMPKVMNIDSAFTVSLMPGLTLKSLLPLTAFLMIKKYGVVTEFEITKVSASTSFDAGWTPDSIFEELTKHTAYEINNNLKIIISEWYNSYSSAAIYYGYVLKVTDTNINFAEKNPNIQKYIKEKLAPGIYLLNVPANANITGFIGESGLDFLGNIKQASYQNDFYKFPLLRSGHKLNMPNQEIQPQEISVEKAEKVIKQLQEILINSDFDSHKKESLEHRIENRLILSPEQLKNAAIRTEILEADGMDFSGKVHLIEAAIKEEDLMELQLPNAAGDGTFFTLVGRPQLVSKQPGEAVCRFEIEPEHNIETILVSRITHLRRLRF